ncbi:MAG: DUF7005 family protein [Bacillota bacterium]
MESLDRSKYRSDVLASFGATAPEIEELLLYNKNFFIQDSGQENVILPLPDEPFVAVWEGYAAEAKVKGVYEVLKDRIIQFKFPIREGISQSDFYQAATRRLGSAEEMPHATGLVLERPESLELSLHQTPAGRIPILLTRHREDFVALVRALIGKNEPVPVPDAMGAITIAGYNNWDRIFTCRKQWECENPENHSEERWQEEFRRIIPQKELYQDSFIILSDGAYSGVPARELGIAEEEWRDNSLAIRREHECAHYFTRRLFSSMRNNMMDELMADYMGIVAAAGHYKAQWFLRFVGLESFPDYREGGRLQNYRGSPPLTDGAFRILQALVKSAAENLEEFEHKNAASFQSQAGKTLMLAALTRLTLEELASKDADSFLLQALSYVGDRYAITVK